MSCSACSGSQNDVTRLCANVVRDYLDYFYRHNCSSSSASGNTFFLNCKSLISDFCVWQIWPDIPGFGSTRRSVRPAARATSRLSLLPGWCGAWEPGGRLCKLTITVHPHRSCFLLLNVSKCYSGTSDNRVGICCSPKTAVWMHPYRVLRVYLEYFIRCII